MVGVILGVILESSRVLKFRWELDDTDFNRIWSFCVVLNVVLAGYVFTNNDAGGLTGMVHGRTLNTLTDSSLLTATRFLRWLPLTTFALLLAQVFNERRTVPLTAISLVLRWRRRRGDVSFSGQYFDIAYPFFFVCLFSAGIHPNNGSTTYFWGQFILVAWALWSARTQRFGGFVWLLVLALVLLISVGEMAGINRAQGFIQNYSAQWMAQFFNHHTDPLQSLTSMGRIGKLKLSAKIVIRLEPRTPGEVPLYLREASYRSYAAQKMTWFAGGAQKDFDYLSAETNLTSWALLRGKKTTAQINIACYLNGWSRDAAAPEGLLPLPSGCGRLENVPPYTLIKTNQYGAVLAAGRGLLIFDALYGHGATMDSPPDTENTNGFDLSVPTNEIPALQTVIAEMKLSELATDYEKRQAIELFFAKKFTYSTWQGSDKIATASASPLSRFLLTSRRGHCEYFASATVLLLRQLHIPARYAVGYAVHEVSGSGFLVRERDAHAWCLVWNQAQQVWQDFDTTPAAWVDLERERTAGEEWWANARAWLTFQFEKLRWRQTEWQQYIFWSLIPVMLVLLYFIFFKRRGKFRSTKNSNKNGAISDWPGLDSEFYQLEKKLAAQGLPRRPDELLSVWLERALREPKFTALRLPLHRLLQLHYAYRFDPAGLSLAQRQELKRAAAISLAEISASIRAK